MQTASKYDTFIFQSFLFHVEHFTNFLVGEKQLLTPDIIGIDSMTQKLYGVMKIF